MRDGAFGRVLVPVELEPASEGEIGTTRAVELERGWVAVSVRTILALELAARLARGGELWLVHAAPDFFDYATWIDANGISELNEGTRRHAAAALRSIAEQHCQGVELHYVVEPGKALDVILESTREHAPDAIVLAASTRGKVHRTFLGSTADKVIRQAPCPVVIVPSGAA